jgi:pyroglutamyl-peptidase
LKLLISGFTNFGTHTENSSQIMAQLLGETHIPGTTIHSIILPVSFGQAFEKLKIEIDNFEPDYVICLGLAGTRQKISLEKVAINLIHCDIPDNEGIFLKDKPIMAGGDSAYFSTLPLNEMLEVQTPYPVEMSLSAGAYVCNYVMYRLLDYVKDTKVKAGFIHLPHLKENRDEISASLVQIIRALF